MLDYGTERAAKFREGVAKAFGRVVWDPAAERERIKNLPDPHHIYKEAVAHAAAVVVLEHDGALGRGVSANVQHAQEAGIPVYVWQDGELHRVRDQVPHPARDYKAAWAVLGAEADPAERLTVKE